jgi:hypothetical protein
MKTTEELIKELSQSHTRISRDFSPLVRTLLFLYVLFAAILGLIYWMRPFTFIIQNPTHAMESISFLFFITSSTYLGFKSFIPGEKKSKSFYFVLFSFVLLLISFGARIFVNQSFATIRPYCDLEAIGASIITTAIAHLILRKNEYARTSHLSKWIILSLPMFVVVYLHGVCSIKLMHVFVCHFIFSMIVPTIYLISSNLRQK